MLDLLHLLLYLKSKAFQVQKDKTWDINKEWNNRVKSTPNKQFLQMVDQTVEQGQTFKSADLAANMIASGCYEKLGLRSNHVIAIIMPSSCEYVLLWLGLMKLGATSALINTNLIGKPLLHAIETAVIDNENGKKFVIVSERYLGIIEKDEFVRNGLAKAGVKVLPYYHATGSKQADTFDQVINSGTDLKWDKPIVSESSGWSRNLFYIYTSGTTGLPKASKINHLRFLSAGSMLKIMSHCSSTDKIYCALPLYHSAGGMVGVSACILSGGTLIIREKFSVTNLAKDIIR